MNARTLFPLVLLITASLSRGQTAAPKISYTTVAVPVVRALEEVSKQAGIRLTASPALSTEIIVLSLKDASLEDVKVQIAKACSARWEAIQGGEMLLPDLVLRRQEEQKERAEYAAAIAKSLKQLVDSLNPPMAAPGTKVSPAEAAQLRQISMFSGGGASGRAVIKLANAIGANAFAAVDARSRVVYSSHPTRMQRPLPGNANQVLAQLVTDHNAELAKRMRDKVDHPEVENEQMKKLREYFGDMGDDDKPVEGIPSKAILICGRQPLFGGLMLTLKVYNEKGKVVITGSQVLSGDGESLMEEMANFEMGPDGLPREKPQPKPPTNEKPIEFSATTKEMMGMSNIMTMASSATKMSDELRMKLLSPDQYDPLSFNHSEALIATAKQRGKQLVAMVPDRLTSMIGMMMRSSDSPTPTAYLASVADAVNVNAEGPFMLVRPAKPAKARTERINRESLGQFLRKVDAKGSVTLDDLAAYAQKSNSPMEDSGAMAYFMIFAPNAVQSGMGGQVSWDALRFYGSLSSLQKKNLTDGGRMSFGQFNPVQAASVRQMAFGPDTNLMAENPDAKKPDVELPSFIRGAIFRQFGGDYKTEPTEVMPNGLPSEGYLELKLTQDSIAKPTGNIPAMFGNAVLGADELAMLKMFKDMPGMEQMAAFMPVIDELRLGERSVYEFKFTVADGVWMEQSLNDDRISAKSPIVKMANLPAAFAKKIDDRLAAFKKLPFFDPAFIGGGNRGVPPPAN